MRKPINVSVTASIAATSSGAAKVSVPANETYFLNSITVTKGTSTTVDSIKFDGAITGQTASFDVPQTFGDLLTANGVIEVAASNAGTVAEDLTVEVVGYSI